MRPSGWRVGSHTVLLLRRQLSAQSRSQVHIFCVLQTETLLQWLDVFYALKKRISLKLNFHAL